MGDLVFWTCCHLGPIFGDVHKVMIHSLRSANMLMSGPPCTPSSKIGQRSSSAHLDLNTFFCILGWAMYLFHKDPEFKLALIENVTDIIRSFGSIKYCLAPHVENIVAKSSDRVGAFLGTQELCKRAHWQTSLAPPFVSRTTST